MAEKQLGDFLKRIKRPIELQPNKRYKLVTIKLYQKGVDLRTEKRGSEIKSPMSIVRAGDFILSGIDARNGAFGIVPTELDGAVVTNDFWCLEIDPLVIDKRLFLELTTATWFNEICRQCSSGTTQRIRLDKRLFFQHTIQLPPLEDQPKILSAILRIKAQQSELQHLFQERAVLIKQLRASLLQEAISGQMTAEWRLKNPNTEPAHILLDRIAEEKAELVRNKKIKKEKPLLPLSNDDTPFDIPEGWIWVRLGRCTANHDFLRSPIKEKDRKSMPGEVPYYGASGVIDYVDGFTHDGEFLLIGEDGSNLNSRNHPIAFIARGKFWLNNHAHALQCFGEGSIQYLENAIAGLDISAFITGGFQPKLSQANLSNLLIPLPPLEEQKEIVRRLEAKLTAVQGLQDKLNEDLETAQKLLKSKLKEVFEKTGAPPTASLSPSV